MAATKRLGLPLIDQGQAMKHITHNEALALLDGIVHLSALSILSNPPASPAEDAIYIVGVSPTGIFESHEKAIALFQNGGFIFVTPRSGWRCFIQDSKAFLVFDGTNWTELGGKQERAARFGVNTTADDVNRFSVSSGNIFFTANSSASSGAGDIRVKVNKDAVGNTASILYQSNLSGRAEMGLMGDDQFRFKVSPRGSDWKDALVIDSTSARVQCPTGISSSRIDLSQALDTSSIGLDGPLALRFFRSRGATTGGRSPVLINDAIGAIVANTWDGTQFIPAAAISLDTDFAGFAGMTGGRIAFSTTSAGLLAPRERIRIDSGGLFRPTFDNSLGLGTSSFRWTDIYAVNGISSVSDEREKVDIVSLSSGLDLLRKLRPVSYRWRVADRILEGETQIVDRPGRRKHLGLIAQEVKAVLDEQSADFGVYTFDPDADRHGLRYDQLIAPLIKAVQELDARIEDLSRRLTLIGH
jgi:Protein of unknown function (DUF2793)/Chaperone of endosialidase